MKLIEALQVLQQPSPDPGPPYNVYLATGFTPLHLGTFLAAHLRNRMQGRAVTIAAGAYGDFVGNVESAARGDHHALAAVLEWSDIDLRLGVRRLGGWSPQLFCEILRDSEQNLARILQAISSAAAKVPVALTLPTLPLPPIAYTASSHLSPFEASLRHLLASFSNRLSAVPNVRMVSQPALDSHSPLEHRFDISSELNSGYPFKNAHADAVAGLLASLLAPVPPKKGIITDLDNTLWAGILGEVGVDGISWDLESHSQAHGLYQQFLSALSASGVLVAVCSKNDPQNVDAAFDRGDLVLKRQQVFPIAAGWGPKSEAVARILRAWNISSDSVVFVDDSPLELAEVKAAHPGIECLQFAASEPQKVWALLHQLRDLFAKTQISEEDEIRQDSLRASAAFLEGGHDVASPDEFLANLNPVLQFNFIKTPPDPRALELINKTNQFNLNGRRFTDADWQLYLRDSNTFVSTVTYQDKFGPLGKIAVATGTLKDRVIVLDRWVMSCRAFSRRIEHHHLRSLFDRFGVEAIEFDFTATPRNSPLQQFFKELTGDAPSPMYRLTRERFLERCPILVHQVEEISA